MSFIKSILGKEIYDLNIGDIIEFFREPRLESTNVEFKSGDVELEKIFTEVTAFLNTEGGILIIGTPKEVKTNLQSEKTCHGELTPSKKIKSVDDLSRSIASNISPAPIGIKIHSLNYNEGRIFILDIPQSDVAPHQDNRQGKYYIRLERESKAAPHGIIEALFFKRQKPNLNIAIEIIRYEGSENFHLIFKIDNQSVITAEGLFYQIQVWGVNKVIKEKNIPTFELIDSVVNAQRFDRDMLLVKGMGLNVSLEFIPSSKMIIALSTVYCKDTVVIHKAVIFEDFKVLDGIDSKIDINRNLQEFLDKWIEIFKSKNQLSIPPNS